MRLLSGIVHAIDVPAPAKSPQICCHWICSGSFKLSPSMEDVILLPTEWPRSHSHAIYATRAMRFAPVSCC
jgi:hypothetical protein